MPGAIKRIAKYPEDSSDSEDEEDLQRQPPPKKVHLNVLSHPAFFGTKLYTYESTIVYFYRLGKLHKHQRGANKRWSMTVIRLTTVELIALRRFVSLYTK